ncbi:hypothetical protein WICMUC_001240 [Wickerhamomyces mucosus]|uniref:S-adenosylmethionine decarboxylase proenzyme n=1 Tax=Wickerhamomyces mucosus TaxID=1378264 RepID=A0A9P8PWT7_9ASCO|nr:hypothetical protein WICMUC_001240 [Wickerhamomyces mucosus]
MAPPPPPIEYVPSDGTFIDHELSVNLDSTEAFEGPEKLLEIWFYPSQSQIPKNNGEIVKSLRSIPFDQWSKLLDLVNCKILSITSSDKLNAFLLSESSLFVYDHKLILKTCGTTTTLYCLNALFKLIKSELNWDFIIDEFKTQPYKVFYSRRAFMFPFKQQLIHQNWNNEVEYLDQFFINGYQYLIGRINNSQWHLYLTNNSDIQPNESFDSTFEILMTELSPAKSSNFITSRKPGFEIDENDDLGHFLGKSTLSNIGLNNLFPESSTKVLHDAFQFTPCGYSSNTIINQDSYYTVHVTPEKDWSYSSFETNVNPILFNTSYLKILQDVLKMFKPNKFQVILINNEHDDYSTIDLFKLNELNGYKKLDKIIYDLGNYQLLYLSFEITEDGLINDLTI